MDFVFCGTCLNPRDVLDEEMGLVEECDLCGDDEYCMFPEAAQQSEQRADGAWWCPQPCDCLHDGSQSTCMMRLNQPAANANSWLSLAQQTHPPDLK